MNKPIQTVQVALPVPLRQCFDYRIPPHLLKQVKPGMRVTVPFVGRILTGLVISNKATANLAPNKLKSLIECLDTESVLTEKLFDLSLWLTDYYQHPIGEVFRAIVPNIYNLSHLDLIDVYSLSDRLDMKTVTDQLRRAPRQLELLNLIVQLGNSANLKQLNKLNSGWRAALKKLLDKGYLNKTKQKNTWDPGVEFTSEAAPALSLAQQEVVDDLSQNLNCFFPALLKGITGSGKTEIYLHIAQQVLVQGQQVLILVPEIALTPQLVDRFERRLGRAAAVLHSALSDNARRKAWQGAVDGGVKIILGTRSAVFTPLPKLGVIIVDEEHDASYKQHEGFLYHARDVAVMRAKLEKVPIILGSATPSLESLANARNQRYHYYKLNQRIGPAHLPSVHLIDMNSVPHYDGLANPLVGALIKNLALKQQSLVFINRRGYAPVLLCQVCGWQSCCSRCHAKLTYHQDKSLRCHHCGLNQAGISQCPDCQSTELTRLGQGTQRIEQTLTRLLPNARIARLDADSTRRKGKMQAIFEDVKNRQIDILVGTQMLSKGHDFPAVSLVIVINADQGLFGIDFRGTETMVQQLIQVAGRAGRADVPGHVFVQTYFPEHHLYSYILKHDYMKFAQNELNIRQAARFPPFNQFALVRACALDEKSPFQFLKMLKYRGQQLIDQGHTVILLDVVAAPMAKRKDRFRAQLLLTAESRPMRQLFLRQWIPCFEANKISRKVRWSLDIDPTDLY